MQVWGDSASVVDSEENKHLKEGFENSFCDFETPVVMTSINLDKSVKNMSQGSWSIPSQTGMSPASFNKMDRNEYLSMLGMYLDIF